MAEDYYLTFSTIIMYPVVQVTSLNVVDVVTYWEDFIANCPFWPLLLILLLCKCSDGFIYSTLRFPAVVYFVVCCLSVTVPHIMPTGVCSSCKTQRLLLNSPTATRIVLYNMTRIFRTCLQMEISLTTNPYQCQIVL